jgi:hypothetical protein
MIIDLTEIKFYLGISDTALDAKLEALIPVIDAKVKSICNDDFEEGFPEANKSIVAKGTYWLMEQQNTSINDTGIISRSVGPLSMNKGDYNDSIDGTCGMPAWFVKGLPIKTIVG